MAAEGLDRCNMHIDNRRRPEAIRKKHQKIYGWDDNEDFGVIRTKLGSGPSPSPQTNLRTYCRGSRGPWLQKPGQESAGSGLGH